MGNNTVVSDVRLSNSEVQVLRRIASGMTSKEVATELYCSRRTVDYHIASIYCKLSVSNRIQVICWARALGLVSVPGMSHTA